MRKRQRKKNDKNSSNAYRSLFNITKVEAIARLVIQGVILNTKVAKGELHPMAALISNIEINNQIEQVKSTFCA